MINIAKIDDLSLLKGIEALKNNFEIPGNIKLNIEKGEKLEIKWDGDYANITYPVKSALMRALSLISLDLKKGERNNLSQTLCFDECGIMLDMSRNGVMTVEAVKKYADLMALMGLNQLYLYMEDTYEIEGCPYFGYMRGRYTKDELKEIDDYCYMLGIEAIPNIQTLGHMEQYIKWDEGMQYRDTDRVLLAGEEKTYAFIEKAIKSVSSSFRTKKIMLGMDESGNLGSGRYYAINGLTDRKKIFINHLHMVCEITEKEGLTPIIAGDVLYALASGNAYATSDVTEIPGELKSALPENLVLLYWNYYDYDYNVYKKMLKSYNSLTGNTIFWGGIWTWFGLAPDNKMTFDTMNPALKASKDTGIRTAIGALFGDDGTECNLFFGILGVMLFAEHMYSYEVDLSTLKERFEYITKGYYDAFYDMSYFHNDFDNSDDYKNYVHRFYGKRFFYADLLIGLMDEELQVKPMSDYYNKLKNRYKGYLDKDNPWYEMYDYIYRLTDIVSKKCYILENLKKSYNAGNKAFLKECADTLIPELINSYEELSYVHKKQWMKTYKPFGYEVLDIRYGGILKRLKSAQEKITEYLNGEISRIEELEVKRLLHHCEWTQNQFSSVATACNKI